MVVSRDFSNDDGQKRNTIKPFIVEVPIGFIVGTVLFCMLIATFMGNLCHRVMFDNLLSYGNLVVDPVKVREANNVIGLPRMYYAPDKVAPKTVYSSRTFIDEASSSANTVLVEKRLPTNAPTSVKVSSAVDDDDEVHEPAGQHLLIDFENIDAEFLNSETRIAQAMVDIVTVSGLTMLSYHCHALTPKGISCVGVLLESHIAVHTWPLEGVLLLDLFTCGPKPLLPLLPLIKSYFGIPRIPSKSSKPNMNWAHKRRGFKTERQEMGVQGLDIENYAIGWLEFDLKNIVASVETTYQSIDLIDVLNPRFVHWEQYEKSLSNDGSYESLHPEFFRPDRFVFMNGVVQSRRYGEAAYHEALVQPALATHESPRRVAIIGGGEGATLREVLKSSTVEKVVMIEIDEMMVNISKQHLPEWNYCGNLIGSAKSCFDDKRVELLFMDAGGWFVERYLHADRIKEEDLFDVVIMDSLDPQDMVDFADALFSSESFLKSIYNSLTEDGIFASQIGEHDFMSNFPDNFLPERRFVTSIANLGFETVRTYSEAHGGFFGVWKYLVAFKDAESKSSWFANQAEIDLTLRKRVVQTSDDIDTPFRFFDGATQHTYQFPSRITENVFCRTKPIPELCEDGHGYDPNIPNVHISSLEVKGSSVEGAGRGIFFRQDFSAGTYVSIDEGSHNIMFYPSTTSIIQKFLALGYTSKWKTFDFYMFGYGFANDYYGRVGFSVDPSIMTFINHGCDKTYNMGIVTKDTEITADPEKMLPELEENPVETINYSPFLDRNHLHYLNGMDKLLQDVKAGDELLDNYLGYLHDKNWKTGVEDYRSQCMNQAMGAITVYETETSIREEF